MLQVKAEQVAELSRKAETDFENQSLEYIAQQFPRHLELVDEADLRRLIRLAVSRGAEQGFDSVRNVTLYLNLMLFLGSEFDADPQLPWVSEILHDPELDYPDHKADKLHDVALAFLDRIWGKQSEYLQAVLAELERLKPEDIAEMMNQAAEDTFIRELGHLYPQKFQLVGAPQLQQLLVMGAATAREYGITTRAGFFVFILLMYLLGAGFHRDPQYAWAGAILSDPGETDKGRALYEAAKEFLQKLQS